jgi:hypothetical protein
MKNMITSHQCISSQFQDFIKTGFAKFEIAGDVNVHRLGYVAQREWIVANHIF